MTFLFSEHIYMYGFTHQRLCCMLVLGYTVLSWCSFSSGVLNFNVSHYYLPTPSNISRNSYTIVQRWSNRTLYSYSSTSTF